MSILHTLESIVDKPARRLGRGYGSKKGGHTSGRGNKGDKIRGSTKGMFDGTKNKKGFIKRLPFMRGKHRVLAKAKPMPINFSYLEKNFKEGDIVKFDFPVKILATGKLTKKLIFKNIPMSVSAKTKLTALGAKIE
jgi:large subunit ribosomal protein L15